MKTQSQSLIDERAKQNVMPFWLAKVGIFCATDCDRSINYNGDTYLPYPLQLSGFRSADGSPLDGGAIKIGNVDNSLSSLVLNNALKNAEVYIYEAWLDASLSIIGADLICQGKVDGRPGLSELWAQVTVAAHLNPWTQRYPRTRLTKSSFPFLPTRGTKFTWGSSIIEVQ